MSVAEGVKQQDAIDSVQHLWQAVKHPRGRDGKFIETGAFVQIYDEPGGPQVGSGRVTAAFKAPDGRTFVGVDVGGGKVVWRRPKQIETAEVKGWIGPKPKDADAGDLPDAPLPSVPEKYDEIHWADVPDYDPAWQTKAATDHDGGWSPHVSKLAPWLEKAGYDPQINDVFTELNENYGLVYVWNPDGSVDSYDVSTKEFADKYEFEEIWAKIELGVIEVVHDHEQPNGVPDSETTGIALIGDVPWSHPDDWSQWLSSVGLEPTMNTVYQADSNPEQLLITDGITAGLYKKGHLVDGVPVDVATSVILSGSGKSSYSTVFEPHAPAAGSGHWPGPEDPYWVDFIKTNNLNPETQVVTNNDKNEIYTAGPHAEHFDVWIKDVNGAPTNTGDTMSIDDVAEATLDGVYLAVWPPIGGPEEGDFDSLESPDPAEGWDNWLKTRSLDSDSPVYKSATGAIFVHPPGNTTLQQYVSLDDLEPSSNSALPFGMAEAMTEDGDWKQVWPLGDLQILDGPTDPLQEWEKELMESAPPATPLPAGPVIKLPADVVANMPMGSIIYTHPQGASIVMEPNQTVTKYNASGKKSATSATFSKLLAGHGGWKQTAVYDSNHKIQMFTDGGLQEMAYDPAVGGLVVNQKDGNAATVAEMKETPGLFDVPGSVAAPNVGKEPDAAWVAAEGDVAWVMVDGVVWSSYKGADWTQTISTTQGDLDNYPEVHKAQYVAGPPGADGAVATVIPLNAPPPPPPPPPPVAPVPAGPPPIKLPKGKTPFDLLWMISTSHANKNSGDTAAQTGFQNELATVLSLSTGYDTALKKLNALMTIAKLGGKQRARYKTLLQMHFGVAPPPGSSQKSAVAGDPGKWQPITPPNGYTTGVTGFAQGNSLINTGGVSAGTAKANIQENLSKRLAGRVTMAQMIAAVSDTDYQADASLVSLTSIANNWGPTKSYTGGHLSKGGHLGIWKWYPEGSAKPPGAIPASQDNFERAMRESLTSQLVQLWAGTSNDTNPRSLAMQEAARIEFGLEGTYEWPNSKLATKKEYDKHGALFREFLRVMYENTQEWGAANGVKYVKLKRGMNVTANKSGAAKGSDHIVELRPMSSFTTNAGTANNFGNGYVIESVVPIEWIIGNAATGFGCQGEYEWVILGGKHKMRRV